MSTLIMELFAFAGLFLPDDLTYDRSDGSDYFNKIEKGLSDTACTSKKRNFQHNHSHRIYHTSDRPEEKAPRKQKVP